MPPAIQQLDPTLAPAIAPATATVPSVEAEAARYTVLRRLGSATRHQMAGALQPVGMLASMLERRVQQAEPNMEALRKNAGEMRALARSSSAECVALMGWVAPPQDDAPVPLAQCVEECVHLLATELSFRGFVLTSTVPGVEVSVDRSVVRVMLPAALMALTDNAEQGGSVQVAAAAEGTGAELVLTFTPAGDAAPAVPSKAYRALRWSDLGALAAEAQVQLQLTNGRIVLSMP